MATAKVAQQAPVHGPGKVNGPGSHWPGARHATLATVNMTITKAGVAARTANARVTDKHGCDAASRASSLALTASARFTRAT